MPKLFNVFADVAQSHPDKTAIVVGDAEMTYAELADLAVEWAGFFRNRLPDQQVRVALLSEDPVATMAIAFGIARLDGVCIPTNAEMTAEQLEHVWRASDANIILFEDRFGEKLKGVGFVPSFSISDALKMNTLDTGEPCSESFPWSEQTGFLITLSSGSTGDPKPIVVSQDVKYRRAKQSWDLYNLDSDCVVLCASPFFHSLGQRLSFIPLLIGGTLVHLGRFSPKAWLDLVGKWQVSFTISVSTHLYALKESLLDHADSLKSLRTLVTSSAPIDVAFKKQLFDTVGCEFFEIYGATEIAIASNLAPEDAGRHFTTVGQPVEQVEIKIVDDQGEALPRGEVGEIACRTPLAFDGYYDKPSLTEASFADGYFLTGDLGFLDDDGFLTYVSRKKDVIIVGGINIYPKDIETVIGSHPDIKDVSVIGIEDNLLGEVVLAICVCGENPRLEQELRRQVNQKLAAFQRPLKYFFVSELPVTASGKVSKEALRAKYGSMGKDWAMPLKAMLYGA